jgi:hypothetical protein
MRWCPSKPPSVWEAGWKRYQPTMLKFPAAGVGLSFCQPMGELPRDAFAGVVGRESKFWV